MKHILYNLIFFVLCLMACLSNISCRSVHWVRIDRLTPSKINISDKVRRVAVTYNQYLSDDEIKELRKVVYLDAKATADTLAQNLADAVYFEEIVVADSILLPDMFFDSIKHELKPTAVENLCRELQVDMLLVVDGVFFVPRGVDLPFVRGEANVHVKCYKSGALWPIASINEKNKLDWAPWEDLKPQMECWAAEVILPFIVPQWRVEELPFYTGANIGQREAAVYIREDNWDGAASIWKQQLEHKNFQRRMEAHLNMAVYHEIKDETVDSARIYAQKALDMSIKGDKNIKGEPVNPSEDYLLISEYIEDIERRGADLKRLKEQMLRFSDDF